MKMMLINQVKNSLKKKMRLKIKFLPLIKKDLKLPLSSIDSNIQDKNLMTSKKPQITQLMKTKLIKTNIKEIPTMKSLMIAIQKKLITTK